MGSTRARSATECSDVCDTLHDTPTQRKFRKLAPFPAGTVFIKAPGMTDADIRRHFRTMKRLGFTCLKGLILGSGDDAERRRVMHMALDEGIIPWWYGEAGGEAITDRLLDRLGIPRDTPVPAIRKHARFAAWQEQLMRARIDAKEEVAHSLVDKSGGARRAGRWLCNPHAELVGAVPRLDPRAIPQFIAWLRAQYGSVANLARAWNADHAGFSRMRRWKTWADVRAALPITDNEYRNLRDISRFKADNYLDQLRERVAESQAIDPHVPLRAGGEMGLFLPFAARGIDLEGIGSVMADGGSLYPSIHLSWHFEETQFEVTRPVYMQASMVQDFFKGGWSAAWESTGGPQQFSGGKGWTPQGAAVLPGFTVDEGVITQLMLSYLAAGFKGFGFWCWTPRTAGWETGEFALLDRNGRPCPRTVRAGSIARAARGLRDELWQARKQPVVGVFTDFDNDAFWGAISVRGRDAFVRVPIDARIGACRAFINANVPWEYVTAANLRAGLAARYPVIYLPAVVAVSDDILAILTQFARSGGRVVMDMPSAWFDDHGRMLPTGPGSPFSRLFGCTLDDFQYSSNVPYTVGSIPLNGCVAELSPLSARVRAQFGNGRPAVTEAAIGNGSAAVIGWEAALMCARAGNRRAEELLVSHALGGIRRPFTCEGAIAYRLSAPGADHYFLINDGPACTAELAAPLGRGLTDVLTGAALRPGAPVAIPACGGRWLRCARKEPR